MQIQYDYVTLSALRNSGAYIMYTLVCIHENMLVFAAVPAHNR